MADLEESWRALLTWMDQKHGWNSSDLKVEWKDVPGAGRGLFASEDIPPETTLLRLPPSALLHPRNIHVQHPNGLPQEVYPRDVVPVARPVRPGGSRTSSGRLIHTVQREGAKRQKAASNSLSDRSRGSSAHSPSPPANGSVSPRPAISALTTTQVLTLYLSLYRPLQTRRTPSTSPWLPYLRTLPDSFRDWHPLTWTISPSAGRRPLSSSEGSGIYSEDGDEEDATWTLLHELARDHLPSSVKSKLEDVSRRYARDKERVVQAMQDLARGAGSDPTLDWVEAWEQVVEEDFLWGWLNVNTRTFYLPLNIPSHKAQPHANYRTKKEDLDAEQQNHTMAPVLDFANHCHTNYRKAGLATNIALVRSIAPAAKLEQKKAKDKPEKKRSKADANMSDSSSKHDVTDTETLSTAFLSDPSIVIKADAISVADASWSARSLHLVSPKSAGEDDTQVAKLDSGDRWVRKNEEVFFPYGGHDDETLFTEYGFVPVYPGEVGDIGADSKMSKGVELGGNPHASVVVDELVDRLWIKVEREARRAKHELLDMQGYLGQVVFSHAWIYHQLLTTYSFSDYTLHTHPAPAQPSHRLLPTLRLLHTPIPAKTVDAYVEQPYFPAQSYSLVLADWLETLTGMKETMSEEVERNVKQSLLDLCEMVERDAEEGLLSLRTKRSRLRESTEGSNEGLDAVERLWESQQRVGRLVASSVRAGTAF